MKFVSELTVGSLLIFPTRGTSKASQRAKAFIHYDIKRARAGRIEHAVRRLRELLPKSALDELLADAGVLVPVPGHAPQLTHGLWVAEHICRALQAEGIGSASLLLLSRAEKVPRSSGHSSAEERPDPAKHYVTLALKSTLERPSKITLVDDVVTRGSTLIGAATRLHEQFPDAILQAFTLARVDNNIDLDAASDMLAPDKQVIHYDHDSGRLERS